MNFDEQKLKRLDNIRLNDNQYENVNTISSIRTLKKIVILTKISPQKVFWGLFFNQSID